MFAKLTSLVGGGSTLPFEVGEACESTWGQWSHFRGTFKADGGEVSLFRISSMSKEDPKLRAARNGIRRLRTLRHPNILTFKDTIEVEERGEAVLYLVTEAVRPLSETLRSLGLEGPQREQYMAMGLHQVVSAISFLNNDCKLIHGNICAASVVVTEALDWKLHAFDLTTEHDFKVIAGADVPLMASSWLVGAQFKPGEVARAEWQVVCDSPPWAVDSWGLGCLMQEVYSGTTLRQTEDLRSTGHIPQAVLQSYQRLLASAPERRLNPAKILENGIFKNKLADTCAFLENLALKDSPEKDTFFKRLPSILPSIPERVAQRKLLPLLSAALEFGGAPPSALGILLTIGEGMTEEDRGQLVIPILTKLFASNDRGIRRGLLENINSFGLLLPASLVEDQVYTNVQNGFTDANPYLRELTLKSMAVLAPKLSSKTLNQNLLKHLAKLQVDEEPAIRANTTVLLGNLAPMLAEATCKKILLNAFTRALKDPFPPARAAGLKAVLNTAKFHSADDVAGRVIPIVGPLCVDPIQEVRASALQCLEHFIKVLQTHSEEMERRAAANAVPSSGSGQTGGVGSTSNYSGGGLLTGLGWAVSSFVSKGGAAEDGVAMAGNAAVTASGHAAIASKQRPAAGAVSAATVTAPASRAAAHVTTKSWDLGADEATSVNVHGTEPENAGNGWEDDDDPLEDMMDAAAAELEARQRLSRVAVSALARPSISTKALPVRDKVGRVMAGGQPSSKGSRGMNLNANKLSKGRDDDFDNW